MIENCVEAPIHVKGIPRKEAEAIAEQYLAKVGLLEKRDEYLGMGKIDTKFWKDIAIPVMEKALGKSK